MKSLKLNKKYKNITIPYFYYNEKQDFLGYIYKDNLYEIKDYYKMFNDFVGFYLEYHLSINGKIKIAHSLEEVFVLLFENYKTFKIPKEYKNEYSIEEYKSIMTLLNYLKDDKIPEPYEEYYIDEKIKKHFNIINYIKGYKYNKLINEMKKYQVDFPTKVKSKYYDRYYYVFKGELYWTLSSLIESIYHIGFYYQFNGDGKKKSYEHSHEHDFESIINHVFKNPKNFIIYTHQKEFFSEQEIEFLYALRDKLISISYEEIKPNEIFYDKYKEFKNNKKYFKLMLYGKKYDYSIKQAKKENLNNHKKNI